MEKMDNLQISNWYCMNKLVKKEKLWTEDGQMIVFTKHCLFHVFAFCSILINLCKYRFKFI